MTVSLFYRLSAARTVNTFYIIIRKYSTTTTAAQERSILLYLYVYAYNMKRIKRKKTEIIKTHKNKTLHPLCRRPQRHHVRIIVCRSYSSLHRCLNLPNVKDDSVLFINHASVFILYVHSRFSNVSFTISISHNTGIT